MRAASNASFASLSPHLVRQWSYVIGARRLVQAIEILDSPQRRAEMIAALDEVRRSLTDRDASTETARMLLSMVDRRH